MRKLEGKVAIVTGAGRGIGRAMSIIYAEAGAKVAVASRTKATVDKVTQEIRDAGGEAIGITCDVGKREQVFDMVAQTVAAFGPIDILVNNAQGFGTEQEPQGSTVYVAVEDTRTEEWEYTFRTGASATLWGMQAVFPSMKERGGKIINFGSASGQLGLEGNTSYNATKEAIRALSRTAAREWGKYGININVINPGLETDAFKSWKEARPDFVTNLNKSRPLGRLGDPFKDGGPLYLFLASSDCDYITGMTFNLNGGVFIAP